jgi:CRISPR/Cas system CSM-associated protein Csm4 (group 5 of RAMP superfamily)
VGRKKAKANHLAMVQSITVRIFCTKNETLYATNFHNNVVHQLDLGEIKEKKKKKVQYIVVFSFVEGRSSLDGL